MLGRRVIPGAAITALVISGLVATAPDAAVALGHPSTPKVPGHSASAIAGAADPKSSTSVPPTGSVATGSYDGPVDGGWDTIGGHTLGGSSVEISRSGDSSKPGSLHAEVLTATEAAKYGLHGLVIALNRTDGRNTAAPVKVTVPSAVLKAAFGADYASRVRWVQVTKPTTSKSHPSKTTKVKTTSSKTSTVMTPQVTSSKTLLVAAGAPVSASGTGSFTATPLTPSSSWDVSAQTGGLSWSYPLRTPPAAAGPAPAVALNYSSQSVDGESASTNNQPSAIGEGWSLSGGGFIERSYVPCSQDTSAVPSSGLPRATGLSR